MKLLVPPDTRFLAELLGHANGERSLEIRHPAFVTFGQLDVVEVGIADKCVRLEVHGRRLFGEARQLYRRCPASESGVHQRTIDAAPPARRLAARRRRATGTGDWDSRC